MRESLIAISKIREANNLCWMAILDIALRKDPEATKKILAEIRRNDVLVTQHEQDIINDED